MAFRRIVTRRELVQVSLMKRDPLASYEGRITLAVYTKPEHRTDGLFRHGQKWLECAACVPGRTPHAHLVIVGRDGVGMRCDPQLPL